MSCAVAVGGCCSWAEGRTGGTAPIFGEKQPSLGQSPPGLGSGSPADVGMLMI